jgi:hypothetical protein
MRSMLFLVVLALTGCAWGSKPVSGWNGTWNEQKQLILEIAPLGTPRHEVAQALQEKGIEFSPNGDAETWSPGMNSTIFYCHRARQSADDDNALPLNIALLFNAEGKLYEVRPSDAVVETLGRSETPDNGVELLPPSPGPASVVADLRAE